MNARSVICLALLAAGCEKRQTEALPPKAVPRPKPPAADLPKAAFPDACAQALRTLPDVGARDDRVVLVLFWARWSAPDKLLMQALEPEIARDAHRWRLIKIDIDDVSNPAKDCDVRSIPTLVAVVNGKPVSQIVGAVPAVRVRRFLETIPASDRHIERH